MSDYLDQSVYADVEDEARADYYAERPDPDTDFDPSDECERCGRIVCSHGGEL